MVAYLQAGHDLIAMMDVQDDFFDSSRQVLGDSNVRTDGEWLWRDDLANYVRRHHVQIPDEFLESIRQRHYIVPEVDDETLDRCAAEAELLMF